MKTPLAFLVLAFGLGVSVYAQSAGEEPSLPHLEKRGTTTQLIVDGKPFLMLAGELGNSSASNVDYMRPIWPSLAMMHLNTVLVPVYWELIEPVEGAFDFRLVDSAMTSARQYDLRMVVLWFGTWKNSMSCYVPSWMKKDLKRFPRARTSDGRAEEIVTPFSESAKKADATAFAAFMKHIKTIDGIRHTVIMVQVENEIGMIPEVRDHCSLAEEAFARPVPPALLNYMRAHREALRPELLGAWKKAGPRPSGTWTEVFGEGPAAEGRHSHLPGGVFGIQKVVLYTYQ